MCAPGRRSSRSGSGLRSARASDDQQEASQAPRRQADPVARWPVSRSPQRGSSRPRLSTTWSATHSGRAARFASSLPVRTRESSGRKAADATHLPYAWTPRRRRRCGQPGSSSSMPTRRMRPPRFPRSLSPTRRFAPRYRDGDVTMSRPPGTARSDCHALSCLAGRGGRLHRPDDAQAAPREAGPRTPGCCFCRASG